MTKKSVLFVFTSADKLLNGGPTGWYLPEAAHPYYVLKDEVLVDFASPKGPNPPLDPGSKNSYAGDRESVEFLKDEEVNLKLETAKALSEVDANDYDAIFYVGGHGPVIDLHDDPDNIALANKFYRSSKVVSAVCHGPAALVGVTDADGVNIFKKNKATGFSNEEEEAAKVPFSALAFPLETKIIELGGTTGEVPNTYLKTSPFTENIVISGKVITGQNPQSAKGVGEAILKALA